MTCYRASNQLYAIWCAALGVTKIKLGRKLANKVRPIRNGSVIQQSSNMLLSWLSE